MKVLTKIFFLMIICIFGQGVIAQNTYCGLTYYYDDGGNRIKREVISEINCGENESGKTDPSEEIPIPTNINIDENLVESLFPNPTSGAVSIGFNKAVTDAQVTITDNIGRKLYAITATGTSIPLDLSNYQPGIYYVKVKVVDNSFLNSVVKE